MNEKPLYIPIILGTARQGRQSEHVANFLLSEMKKRPEIETELIDVRQLKMRLDDAGETMKDPETGERHTAHTLNPVPVILVNPPAGITGLVDGRLSDIAPTLLTVLGLPKPAEMTGKVLVQRTSERRASA